MLTDRRTFRLELPASLLTGARVISETPMQKVSIEFCLTPDVLMETPNGLAKLPAAEGLLVLLTNGWPAPEPMTIGLTQFFLTNGQVVLVCSQLAKNHGVSVTKAWPTLAEHVLKIAGIVDPRKAVFVEHYFHGSYDEPTTHATDDFYLVKITWNGDKAIEREWQPLAT